VETDPREGAVAVEAEVASVAVTDPREPTDQSAEARDAAVVLLVAVVAPDVRRAQPPLARPLPSDSPSHKRTACS